MGSFNPDITEVDLLRADMLDILKSNGIKKIAKRHKGDPKKYDVSFLLGAGAITTVVKLKNGKFKRVKKSDLPKGKD